MSLFGKTTDEDVQVILTEIEKVQKELASLKGEKKAVTESTKLADEIVKLKKELVDLEIQKDRATETHDREKRDVEHMVGLERKRQEFEVVAAKREISISIREENLKADRERFEEQMQFMSQRMEKEVTYLQSIATQLMERLPSVEVNKTLEVIDGGTPAPRASRKGA